ncbi:hypothetical protein [Tessaracoccus defluvii]|uniref:hypothetical protein n=1 Tax=Tessaracoccus defluvii TaxID=1285901 RepID=UPI0031CFF44F
MADEAWVPLAQGIALFLADQGLDARVGVADTDDGAIVVLLASQLPAGLQALLDLPGRLVPVAVGPVDPAAVPGQLAELNWVPWAPQRAEDSLQAIFGACVTELGAFHALQSLEAKVRGWEASGRNPADLVDTRAGWRALMKAVASVPTVSPETLAFLNRSRTATHAATLRSVLRGLVWITLLAVAIPAVMGVRQTVVAYQERQGLLQLATGSSDGFLPSIQIPKFAALVKMSDDAGEPVPLNADAQLALLLSSPGPSRSLTTTAQGMLINSTAVAPDGQLMALSGDGKLWRGQLRTTETELIATLPHPGYLLATDQAHQTWAAADDVRLTVGRDDAITTTSSRLGSGISGLVMDSRGTTLLVRGDDETEVYSLAASPRLLGRHDDVVGYGEVEGRLILLKRSGSGVIVIAAATGEELRTVSVVSEVDAATITDNGSVVTVIDGRLWIERGGSMTRSGIAVPTRVTDLQAVSDNEVLVTTIGGGTRLIDTATDLPGMATCTSGLAFSLEVSHDGAWVVCRNSGQTWIWDLSPARPMGPGIAAQGLREASGGVTWAGIMDGRLALARHGAHLRLNVAGRRPAEAAVEDLEPQLLIGGTLTALALSPDGSSVAYASDDGSVVVADVSPDLGLKVVAVWRAPDAVPVNGLEFTGDALLVRTTSATWSLNPCAGCRLDRGVLWEALSRKQEPCYEATLADIVPSRALDALGIRLCEGSGGP